MFGYSFTWTASLTVTSLILAIIIGLIKLKPTIIVIFNKMNLIRRIRNDNRADLQEALIPVMQAIEAVRNNTNEKTKIINEGQAISLKKIVNIQEQNFLHGAAINTIRNKLVEMMIDFDDKGNMIYANDNLCNINGYTLDELSGKDWQSMVHYSERESFLKEWNAAYADKRNIDITCNIVHNITKKKTLVRWFLTPIICAEEKLLQYSGEITAVTN